MGFSAFRRISRAQPGCAEGKKFTTNGAWRCFRGGFGYYLDFNWLLLALLSCTMYWQLIFHEP
ncbi:unnamed protein product [Moneuplotes crassus]|uniref:Uncharacterized protein n=1 Tax=Euplotes crassus TaxID=5936 RepID=A0AAD1XSB6_EUPCR|nr:unnamed protein product [Moneuplotes crassus]